MPKPQVLPSAVSNIKGILTAALAAAGTITVNYPMLQPASAANPNTKSKGHFFGVGGHKLVTQNSQYSYPNDFEITYGAPAAGMTLTWRNAAALPVNTAFTLQMNEMGNINRAYGGPSLTGLFPGQMAGPGIVGGASGADAYLLNLGAPTAAAANDIALAQAIAGAANAVLAGTRAVAGVVYMDVPRGVQAVSSGAGDTTQNIIVTGTDIYGQAMTERLNLNGVTIVFGKKAFFTITRVAVSAALAGNLTVGSSTVLGLPTALYGAGYVLKEVQDGAAAAAGTFVSAVTVTPTNLTGDVRGTYSPNVAPDGTKALHLIAFLANPGDVGQVQA